MKQLHQTQIEILKNLLFRKSARYSEIKPLEMEPAQFVFHLNKLIEADFIKKGEDTYALTDTGKEFANRITTEANKIEERVKATTVLIPVRTQNNELEFLIYKRLKNPFYGCFGFATEKPFWGETYIDAASRGLHEETNLTGTPQLCAIKHYVVYSNEKLVEDKLMHAFIFNNPTGDLQNTNEGTFEWIKESELKHKVDPPLEEFWDFYNAYKTFDGNITFEEKRINTERF